MTDTSTRRKLLPRADRRASILRAAARAFARSGFGDTSMTDVATEAGVTRVLVYRHFESKEALYLAVLDQTLESLGRNWEELGSGSSRTAAMESHLRTARENPDGYRLLWVHAGSEPRFADHIRSVRQLLAEFADERVGDAVRAELRQWAMATLVATSIEATLAWLDHGTPAHDEQFIETAGAGLASMLEGWADPAALDAHT
jgi:AcrR family transcriptional regulator